MRDESFVLISTPTLNDVFEDAFKRAATTGAGVIFVGIDQGESDWSTEVEGVRHSDGTIEITSIHHWRQELDLEAKETK